MKKYDVICIGVVILDSTIKGFDPEPVSVTGYRAESGSISAGGDAVNESIAAAKLGLKSAILCSVGKDPAGDIIADELKRNDVCTDLIIRSDEHPTPITTIFVGEDGNRKSITNSAHKYNFHPERCIGPLTETKAIIIGSLFRAPFNDTDVIGRVVRAAKEAGALIFADTKLPNFGKLSLDDISEYLPYIDYITPNEDEGKYYTGKEDPEDIADAFLTRGANNVIVKLGARGCFFKNRETTIHVPALKVDAVDATGAGDNFIAGFVSEIIRGSEISDALGFASACGAVCSTEVGSGTALKSREQVLNFLK